MTDEPIQIVILHTLSDGFESSSRHMIRRRASIPAASSDILHVGRGFGSTAVARDLIEALPFLYHEFVVLDDEWAGDIDPYPIVRKFRDLGVQALMAVAPRDRDPGRSRTCIEGRLVVRHAGDLDNRLANCLYLGVTVFRRTLIESYAHPGRVIDIARVRAETIARREMGACVVAQSLAN